MGIVGGSGCGKTTLARAILGLHRLDAGSITLAGREVQAGTPDDLQHTRSHAGLVFQDPRAALNPAKRIGSVLEEGTSAGHTAMRLRLLRLLEAVGLSGPTSTSGPTPSGGSGSESSSPAPSRPADP